MKITIDCEGKHKWKRVRPELLIKGKKDVDFNLKGEVSVELKPLGELVYKDYLTKQGTKYADSFIEYLSGPVFYYLQNYEELCNMDTHLFELVIQYINGRSRKFIVRALFSILVKKKLFGHAMVVLDNNLFFGERNGGNFGIASLCVRCGYRPLINCMLIAASDTRRTFSIDCYDKNNKTAIHYAALFGDDISFRALLELGADTTIIDCNGLRATDIANKATIDKSHLGAKRAKILQYSTENFEGADKLKQDPATISKEEKDWIIGEIATLVDEVGLTQEEIEDNHRKIKELELRL